MRPHEAAAYIRNLHTEKTQAVRAAQERQCADRTRATSRFAPPTGRQTSISTSDMDEPIVGSGSFVSSATADCFVPLGLGSPAPEGQGRAFVQAPSRALRVSALRASIPFAPPAPSHSPRSSPRRERGSEARPPWRSRAHAWRGYGPRPPRLREAETPPATATASEQPSLLNWGWPRKRRFLRARTRQMAVTGAVVTHAQTRFLLSRQYDLLSQMGA